MSSGRGRLVAFLSHGRAVGHEICAHGMGPGWEFEAVWRRTVAFCLGGAWMAMIGTIFSILLDDFALADMIAAGSRID